MTAPILEARSVGVRCGRCIVVANVDLTVAPGELRALIGPNGAGKSTLLGVLSGAVAPTAGTIRLNDRNITGTGIARRVRLGIAQSFQTPNLFWDRTALEQCRLAARGNEERARDALARLGLDAFAACRADALDAPARKRLDVALALATAPQVLLLDEPFGGMSRDEIRRMQHLVRRLAGEIAVVVAERDVDAVAGICDTATTLHDGRVVATVAA